MQTEKEYDQETNTASNKQDEPVDTASNNQDEQGPVFKVPSAQIADSTGTDKKFVVYTIVVRYITSTNDSSPAILKRRYTDFYNLYTSLKNQHADLMANVNFPRKVLTGNFDNELIFSRALSFENLFKHILSKHNLRYSSAFISFLQDNELNKAKKYVGEKDYALAIPLLENNFRLLNKIFTDRMPAVIFALIRLLGCCVSLPDLPSAEKWAEIALHRYEEVCDGDLLELYLPLLNVCNNIWWQVGKNQDSLKSRLLSLKQQGIKVNDSTDLLEALNNLEQRIGR